MNLFIIRYIIERGHDMLSFKSMQEAQSVFKALSAPMRLRIMEILYEEGEKNMGELAHMLKITNSAISLHVAILLEADLVEIHSVAGKRGSLKMCRPKHNRLEINLRPYEEERNYYKDDIPVGYYTDSRIEPTCGIATKNGIIGEFDDPRYFLFPEHFESEVFWFGIGYVEYNLPNHLQAGQQLKEIQLSFEISSECPGYNEDYPSDIHFSLNGISLGYWVSPGDFGKRRGRFTPNWWPEICNQYGLLKTLSITEGGTFIDGGFKISEITIEDLALDYTSKLAFRFEVPRSTANPGGFTIFGTEFGDYHQGIQMKTFYEQEL